MKIYLASSWRNPVQPSYVDILREAGHEVYDFRNPGPGLTGFSWSEIDPDWREWEPENLRLGLGTSVAARGFKNDMDALRACDACVLLLPCGRSAHLEAGWAAGAGKRLVIMAENATEPELMYLMGEICVTHRELLAALTEGGDAQRPHHKSP